MLTHRLITGPLLIAFLLAVVLVDDMLADRALRGLPLFVVAIAAVALGAVELTRIFRAGGIRTPTWLAVTAAVAGLAVSYAAGMVRTPASAGAIMATGMAGVLVLALFTLSARRTVEGVAGGAGATLLAFVYLGVLLGFLLALRREHSAWWIVGVVLTTKASDIGAFFTGRAIGRHKLIPWLSPGKTWEGMWGGIAFAAVVGAGLAALSYGTLEPEDQLPIWLGVVAGVVFAVVGQLGDLTMSLFKRGAGIKDSSRMLPGLGGVLDVLDSPLMVAPVAYWLLT